MKLLKKYRSYTYSSLCMVILIGFLSNYILFKNSNHESANKVIESYRKDIEDYAVEHGTLRPLLSVNSKFGNIVQADSSDDLERINDKITDTLAYDVYQDEMVIYRKMIFPVRADDGSYIVQLMLPTIEMDTLIGTILVSLLIFTLLFILFTTIMDYSFSRHIFRPFHKILEAIKDYDIEKNKEILLAKNDIDEFRELNHIVRDMIDKIYERYDEMKEFLEFTSHELQTPLAIIQLKLEALDQKGFEDPEVIDNLSSIQYSLNRLTSFNRSILLIVKIRNGQYAESRSVDLKTISDQYIVQYEELLSIRNITFSYGRQESFRLELHPMLAEQLIQNILGNAIKHNYNGGSIRIDSYKDRMCISNSFRGSIPDGDLFEKYNHTPGRRDSSGLGLAIAKTICLKNNIDISYKAEDHIFTIRLMQKKKGDAVSD